MKNRGLYAVLIICSSFLLATCENNAKNKEVVHSKGTTETITTEKIETTVEGSETTTDEEQVNSAEESSYGTNYEQISVLMEKECTNVFSQYYELLGIEITKYQEEVVNGNVEAFFFYKLSYKNFDIDPDTVAYIKKAKDSGSSSYKQMYDEYLHPHEMNFMLKVIEDENDLMTL